MDYAQSNMLYIQKVSQLAKQTGHRLYLESTGASKIPSLAFDVFGVSTQFHK